MSSCCRCPQRPSIYQTPTPTPYYEYDNNYQYYAPPSYRNNAPGNYADYDLDYQGYQYVPSVPDSGPFDYPVAR
ncbi:MAG: hypothetical protein HON23_01460 [Rickettsiales bacterium]|nr:hypothetical protein [Rickettsiales bacterium]